MKITILGTSEAIPTAKKSQTSIHLKYNKENILVDCGEGTQRQLQIAGINPCKLTRILITHWHGDHILGIPGLLQTLALNNYSKTLHVYGPKHTKHFMSLILKMFIFFGKLKIEVHELDKDGIFLETENFTVKAYKMKHFVPCLAYKLEEKDRRKIKIDYLKKIGLKQGPLIGQLQKGKAINFNNKKITPTMATEIKKGKKVAFIFDTAMNENCITAAKDVDLLISEATFLEAEHADKAKERGHLTAMQAGTIAKKAKVKQLLLTHISQRYAKDESCILNEAKKVFKNCKLATDFMKIVL